MMSAEIGREKTTYSPFATKNVSAIAPGETTYDWSNTVRWTVSNTAWVCTRIRMLPSVKPGSHIPPTYLWRSRRLQLTTFGVCPSVSPAHLRWIADVLKFARNELVSGLRVYATRHGLALLPQLKYIDVLICMPMLDWFTKYSETTSYDYCWFSVSRHSK